MTCIVLAQCKLFLKAAGINQSPPCACYPPTAIISDLIWTSAVCLCGGRGGLNHKHIYSVCLDHFEGSFWAASVLGDCRHPPLCRLYFKTEWKWQTLISALTFFFFLLQSIIQLIPPHTSLQVKLKVDSSCVLSSVWVYLWRGLRPQVGHLPRYTADLDSTQVLQFCNFSFTS